MKKASNDDLNKALGAQGPGGPVRDREDFWSDFKARARMRAQEVPEEDRRIPVGRWALASACSALILVSVLVYFFGPMQAEAAAGMIKSVEVVAGHSAVLVIDDAEEDFAMVWVVDMETDSGNGGGT